MEEPSDESSEVLSTDSHSDAYVFGICLSLDHSNEWSAVKWSKCL